MKPSSKSVLIRVNIVGFSGEPATVFCAYDPETEVLLVSRQAKVYDGSNKAGFLKITNSTHDEGYDALFSDGEMREAIRCFFELESLRLLTLGTDAVKFNPSHRIDRTGMDDKGVNYNIHPDTANAQVAVLAAALWSGRQRGLDSSNAFFEELYGIQTI